LSQIEEIEVRSWDALVHALNSFGTTWGVQRPNSAQWPLRTTPQLDDRDLRLAPRWRLAAARRWSARPKAVLLHGI